MSIAARHRRRHISTKTYDYIDSKVRHMAQMGIACTKHKGIGRNGGACPDHLVDAYDEEQIRAVSYRRRRKLREMKYENYL